MSLPSGLSDLYVPRGENAQWPFDSRWWRDSGLQHWPGHHVFRTLHAPSCFCSFVNCFQFHLNPDPEGTVDTKNAISWECQSDLALVSFCGGNDAEKGTLTLAELRHHAMIKMSVPDIDVQGHILSPLMKEKVGGSHLETMPQKKSL